MDRLGFGQRTIAGLPPSEKACEAFNVWLFLIGILSFARVVAARCDSFIFNGIVSLLAGSGGGSLGTLSVGFLEIIQDLV